MPTDYSVNILRLRTVNNAFVSIIGAHPNFPINSGAAQTCLRGTWLSNLAPSCSPCWCKQLPVTASAVCFYQSEPLQCVCHLVLWRQYATALHSVCVCPPAFLPAFHCALCQQLQNWANFYGQETGTVSQTQLLLPVSQKASVVIVAGAWMRPRKKKCWITTSGWITAWQLSNSFHPAASAFFFPLKSLI